MTRSEVLQGFVDWCQQHIRDRLEKDLLAQLLALNLAVAARIARGEKVTAPGIPAAYPAPATLITADCIRPVA